MSEVEVHTGRVKFFDPVRGYGFIVSEVLGEDVMIHKSALKDQRANKLPRGTDVEFTFTRQPKGLIVDKVLGIDLTFARSEPERSPSPEKRLLDKPGPFEPAQLKWFSLAKGYGFLTRMVGGHDVFVHAQTIRRCGLDEIGPDDRLEVRIAPSERGLVAVEVRHAA